MANKKIWLGILVVVLVFGMAVLGCDDGSSDSGSGGTFTMTDIPSMYNGAYAIVWAWAESASLEIFGGVRDRYSAQDGTAGIRISNGTVSIPLWAITGGTNGYLSDSLERYTGSHTVELEVEIYSPQTTQVAEVEFYPVAFSNGSATRSFNDGDYYPEP